MKRDIVILAHNIRSLWNVGSLFRSSDCFGVSKIFLTGYTATPPRREISKTALGAEEWIPWEYQKDPLSVLSGLKQDGYQIVALEQTDTSISIDTFKPSEKLCLIIGHEVTGVPLEQLEVAEAHIHIPMHGKKESLNVSVATGIALHIIREK